MKLCSNGGEDNISPVPAAIGSDSIRLDGESQCCKPRNQGCKRHKNPHGGLGCKAIIFVVYFNTGRGGTI